MSVEKDKPLLERGEIGMLEDIEGIYYFRNDVLECLKKFKDIIIEERDAIGNIFISEDFFREIFKKYIGEIEEK